jgi:uncharacterized RDD family membrane protein YckC
MSSAQLDIHEPSPSSRQNTGQPQHADHDAEDAPFALKQQVAERLAAHRARRRSPAPSSTAPIPIATPAKARAARIAAAVAERYANSTSYRAFLAAEAENAIRQAEAAAEVAVLTAQAVADAQYSLLEELDQLPTTPQRAAAPASVSVLVPSTAPEAPAATPLAPAPQETSLFAEPELLLAPTQTTPAAIPTPIPGAGVTVRLFDFEDVTLDPSALPTSAPQRRDPSLSHDEAIALDEEIAFRQAPVFEEPSPTVDIPANLIEFPRQLVAARRARPRLAEGPLLEEAAHSHDPAQLRIFEVEATQLSTTPVVETAAPEWSSIHLDALPITETIAEAAATAAYTPVALHTAGFNLRLMAAAVDTCIVLASVVAFIAIFAFTAGHLSMALPILGLIAAGAFAIFTAIYQILFFTFSDATPGMRYARIGLCTFSDDNPSRSAMRRRIIALLLSAAPLAIGILWAAIDSDGLGWHDRISRMYQRSY